MRWRQRGEEVQMEGWGGWVGWGGGGGRRPSLTVDHEVGGAAQLARVLVAGLILLLPAADRGVERRVLEAA